LLSDIHKFVTWKRTAGVCIPGCVIRVTILVHIKEDPSHDRKIFSRGELPTGIVINISHNTRHTIMKSNLLVSALAALCGTVIGAATAAEATPCSSLTGPEIPGATVTSINGTQTDTYCAVELYLTHGNASDNVLILTWLPLAENWNGRYQGIGGGGLIAGGSSSSLVSPVAQGYVSGTTDAGLSNEFSYEGWGSDPQLLENFAHLSIHEMTVVGKALAKQYYGEPVSYSYWNGCSTGGRQGYMAAQRYPEDYNGVYAGSPAINYAIFQVTEMWPFVVQTEEGEFVDECIFDTLTNAAIALCDADDGAVDGVITNPDTCEFDADSWVGLAANCDGDNVTITENQAKIFNKITYGPVDTSGNKLFTGISLGASFSLLASSTPFSFIGSWVQDMVMQKHDYNLSLLTYENFAGVLQTSLEEYDEIIGSDNPDLSSFRDAGGKLLSWHGFADSLILGNGTIYYRLRVEDLFGGPSEVDDFYRLFMAPGVEHCGGGVGAAPNDPFDAVVAWVENGTAPDTLAASGQNITRNLCRYPSELQYSGSGDINDAESWTCT
jgi:feruloyl esterase